MVVHGKKEFMVSSRLVFLLKFNSNLIWIHKTVNCALDTMRYKIWQGAKREKMPDELTRTWMKWSTGMFYDNFAIKVRQNMQISYTKRRRCVCATHSINFREWLHYPAGSHSRSFIVNVVTRAPRPFRSDKLTEIMRSRSTENFLIKRHRRIAILFNFKCQSWLLQIVCTWKKSIAHSLTSEIRFFSTFFLLFVQCHRQEWRRRQEKRKRGNWQVNRLAKLEWLCRVTNKMCVVYSCSVKINFWYMTLEDEINAFRLDNQLCIWEAVYAEC